MKASGFLLVSPGAVDGYPPVQYQASLLADAGYEVELVTLPQRADQDGASFKHSGVRVTCLPGKLLRPRQKLLRVVALVRAVAEARKRLADRSFIEISFDPIGIWISDLTPRKPSVRVAHLHEALPNETLFVEKRLPSAIRRYNHVVVADHDRAEFTQEKLRLAVRPIVLENFPLRASALPERDSENREIFEVVYCGTIGLKQKLDTVIRSVPRWPDNTVLTLIGRTDTQVSQKLISLAHELNLQERVRFLGWMDLPEAEARMAKADLGIALLDGSTRNWRTALGASNKRYQFMKCGLPQISDANPGIEELIAGNGIGACVAEHDPGQIARLVALYAANPERCRKEGAQAFALHQQTYNYQAVFPRLTVQLGISAGT